MAEDLASTHVSTHVSTNVSTDVTHAPGDFSFVSNPNERSMLEDAWAAITKTNSWTFMTQEPEHGYSFTRDPALDVIAAEMKYCGHSGYTYGWTLRTMQLIARNGWQYFAEKSFLS